MNNTKRWPGKIIWRLFGSLKNIIKSDHDWEIHPREICINMMGGGASIREGRLQSFVSSLDLFNVIVPLLHWGGENIRGFQLLFVWRRSGEKAAFLFHHLIKTNGGLDDFWAQFSLQIHRSLWITLLHNAKKSQLAFPLPLHEGISVKVQFIAVTVTVLPVTLRAHLFYLNRWYLELEGSWLKKSKVK